MMDPKESSRHVANNIFKGIYLTWLHVDSNFIKICSQGSKWQLDVIGSDNNLVTNGRQAYFQPIITPIADRSASPGLNISRIV